MKNIKLDSDNYEVFYECLLLNTEGYKGPELRIANKVLDKFEAIGKIKDGKDGERGLWTLESPLAEVSLEDAEFILLKKAFNSVSWSGRGLRKVAKAYDLLETPG